MQSLIRAIALVSVIATTPLIASAQGTGLVFLEPDRYRSIPLAPPTGLTSIPPEMDLSKDFPTPGDQGAQGSCVGWAVGYALKSYQERRERLWTNWDDTRRMSPAFVYNQIRVGDCNDGARIADALDLVTSIGAAAWIDQPYREDSCNDLPTALAKQNAAVNRVAAWFRVNPQDRQAIKTSIAAGIPVVVGMVIDDRFKALKSGETWRGGGVPGEAHALVVVGYSDSRDAVKVINSWGTGWGDGGFGWIDFETFRAVTREAYVAQDIVLPLGAVERTEHPYTVKTGPFGPAIFGLQLGMSRTEVEQKATRAFSTRSVESWGESTTRFTINTELDRTRLHWVTIDLDDKNNFVQKISLRFGSQDRANDRVSSMWKTPDFERPEVLQEFERALTRAIARVARPGRRGSNLEIVRSIDTEVIPQLPSLPVSSVFEAMIAADARFELALRELGVSEWQSGLSGLMKPNEYGRNGSTRWSRICCHNISFDFEHSRHFDDMVKTISGEIYYNLPHDYSVDTIGYDRSAIEAVRSGMIDSIVSTPRLLIVISLEAKKDVPNTVFQ